MTACDDKILLLNALQDGELDAANTIALEQHLKTCPGCASTRLELQRVRGLLSSDGLAHAAPEALRRRIAIALELEGRTPAAPNRRLGGTTWRPWAVGGGAVAALAAALVLYGGQTAQAQLGDDLVSDHIRSLLAEHLTDVATSDRHTVKPWFDGKVAFAPTVIDFADKGYSLVGGRLDYLQGQRVAALVFRRRLHSINVFVWPQDAGAPRPQNGARQGYNLVQWSAGGLVYCAVSDLDRTELAQLRDLYVSAQKPDPPKT